MAQLQAEEVVTEGNGTKLHRETDALIGQLKASGHLPQNASFDYVSQCVSTRLEPSLFPYRPKVGVQGLG